MRGLNQFRPLQHEAFFKDKTVLIAKPPKDWTKDGRVLGTSFTLEVDADGTEYANPETSNEGEQFIVKSDKPMTAYRWAKRGVAVTLVNVTASSVYGDFGTELSMRCDLAQAKADK